MNRRAGHLRHQGFGRRTPFSAAALPATNRLQLSPDLKLFAAAYAAGFLVMSLFIA